MRSRFTQLYLHSVWATWDRMPLLVPAIEQTVYAAILAKCRQLDCEPLAIGGMADHVHLLVRFPTTLTVADLVKEVKGATSHLVTHENRERVFQVARVIRRLHGQQGVGAPGQSVHRRPEAASW